MRSISSCGRRKEDTGAQTQEGRKRKLEGRRYEHKLGRKEGEEHKGGGEQVSRKKNANKMKEKDLAKGARLVDKKTAE